jgi:putative transposase
MMLALQAARNVKTKAIETYGLNVVKKKVRRDSPKPVPTTLFNVGMYERSSDNTLPQKGKRRVGSSPRVQTIVSLGYLGRNS